MSVVILPASSGRSGKQGHGGHQLLVKFDLDDISENLDVVEGLERKFSPDLVLLESGGDNLTATFSKALVDVQIFVLDVAGGDKVPRKGGPGIAGSDLLAVVQHPFLDLPQVAEAVQPIPIAERLPGMTVGLHTRADAPLSRPAAALARLLSEIGRRTLQGS